MNYFDLANVAVNFPHHYFSVVRLSLRFRIYFETSALNHILGQLDAEAISVTRSYLASVGKAWMTSPVALWELMLTRDESALQRLVFAAQNILSPCLFATPSEIVVRYLEHAYPKNRVNYSFLTKTPLGRVWKNLAKNNALTFVYDKEELRAKTHHLRAISRSLPAILEGRSEGDELIVAVLAQALDPVLEQLRTESINLPPDDTLNKFVVIYAALLLVFLADIDGQEVRTFWRKKGLDKSEAIVWLLHVFRRYPEIFWKGPILEMAGMAHYQYRAGRRDRGVILDGMHLVYTPYCNVIVSADDVFTSYREQIPHYLHRIAHTSELVVTRTLYSGPRRD